MVDHGIKYSTFRSNLVPAVISLANPPWQRDVWLRRDAFEDLDYVVHVLFDDFCDAIEPAGYLGLSLRTEEEVELMGQLGAAYSAVQQAVGWDAADEVYLAHEGWAEVVAAAGRLAQVMVGNDLTALAMLDEAGHRWPLNSPTENGTGLDEMVRTGEDDGLYDLPLDVPFERLPTDDEPG